MFVFRKIWRALFPCNTRWEIYPFVLLPTISPLILCEFKRSNELSFPLKLTECVWFSDEFRWNKS